MANLDIQIGQLPPRANAVDTDSVVLQSGALTFKITKEDFLKSHLENYGNPHQVTKAQVGLGNVSDLGVTNDYTVSSETLYASAKAVNDAFTNAYANAKNDLDAHKANYNNPHLVSKSQVGLGNVKNYNISNSYTSNRADQYASSQAVKNAYQEAINSSNQSLSNHRNDWLNPHRVTKAQVQLGNVQNYGKTDELGSSTTLYATQKCVENGQIASANFTVQALANYSASLTTPTKSTIGLGSVPNWTEGGSTLGVSATTFPNESSVNKAINDRIESLRVSMLPSLGTILIYNNLDLDPNNEPKYAGTTWEKLDEGYSVRQAPHSTTGTAGAKQGLNNVVLNSNHLPAHTHPHNIVATDKGHNHQYTDQYLSKFGSGMKWDENALGNDNNYQNNLRPTYNSHADIEMTGSVLSNTTSNVPVDVKGAAYLVNLWKRIS